MSDTTVWSGHALIGDSLEERGVSITVKQGIIVSIEEITNPPPRWICPSFFNAHTHLGDTIAIDIPAKGSLSELVAPPDGLKHRLLRAASVDDLTRAMRQSIRYMQQSGTGGFADFREGGREGVNALKSALDGEPSVAVIFGREGGEALAHGVGISSAKEHIDIEGRVKAAKREGKLVAFHAGEKDPEDVNLALEYEPDLLVHCTYATDGQLRRIADQDIPVVVCPRSNWILGVARSPAHPPLKRMRDLGCRLLLGTDNVMFIQPDMFREMSFTSLVYGLSAEEILKMAISGSVVFGRSFFIEEGNDAHFFIIDPMRSNIQFSHDHRSTIVKRGECTFIETRVFSKVTK